jgi:hypothetical protein
MSSLHSHIPIYEAGFDVQEASSERMLSLTQAAHGLPAVRGKKPPHPNTLLRWAKVGVKSKSGKIVQLEICRVGGTNFTSQEALMRFFTRLNDMEPAEPPSMPFAIDEKLKKQAEEAKRILKERGLIDE